MAIPDFEKLLVDSSSVIADLVVNQVGRDEIQLQDLYCLATQRTGQLAGKNSEALQIGPYFSERI